MKAGGGGRGGQKGHFLLKSEGPPKHSGQCFRLSPGGRLWRLPTLSDFRFISERYCVSAVRSEREASELWLCFIVPEEQGCPRRAGVWHSLVSKQEYKSFIPPYKYEHEMNKHQQTISRYTCTLLSAAPTVSGLRHSVAKQRYKLATTQSVLVSLTSAGCF